MIQCCGWKLEASRGCADSITPIIKADRQHPSSAPLLLPSSSSDFERELKDGSLQDGGARLLGGSREQRGTLCALAEAQASNLW